MYENDEQYKEQLLKYFNLPDYQGDVIMQKIERLQKKVEHIPEIREKAFEAGAHINSKDMEMCLVLLFSYDHFNEFRKLLAKYNISV